MVEIKTRIVTRESKTRKGKFVVFSSKGKPTREYKLEKGKDIKELEQYYRKRYITKQTRSYKQHFTKKQKQTAKDYVKQIKRSPKIGQTMRKGVVHTKIEDIHKISMFEIHEAKKRLLKPLVKDNALINILASMQNFSKLQHRLEYRIEFRDKTKLLATGNMFNKTPEVVINNLKRKARLNTEVLKSNYEGFAGLMRKWDMESTNVNNKGILRRIDVTMILRKG